MKTRVVYRKVFGFGFRYVAQYKCWFGYWRRIDWGVNLEQAIRYAQNYEDRDKMFYESPTPSSETATGAEEKIICKLCQDYGVNKMCPCQK